MKYKTIDLFAGIGGIRRGFELTKKFKNVMSAEIDDYACKTYEYLFKENPKNDVTSAEFKKIVEKTKYDVLIAGFPCQAFSSAGKKEGFRDTTRGTLFFDVADILERTKPKAFMLENVEGLLTHKKGSTFGTILEILVKELNYKVIGVDIDTNDKLIYNPRSFLLNSRNFGLPQNRPRVYIVGFSDDYYGEFSKKIPNNSLPSERRLDPIFNDVNEILEENVSEKYYLSQGYLNTLKRHKDSQKEKGNGFGYQILNRPGISNPISNAILATGGSGKERNLLYSFREDFVGREVKNKKTPLNSEGVRVMTPLEWGRLQGFIGYAFLDKEGKEKFDFPHGISDAQKYKQLGNSVAIPVIEEIAYTISQNLDWLENMVHEKELVTVAR
jgi:DNA (cytosine-5)-methyltransferase 1